MSPRRMLTVASFPPVCGTNLGKGGGDCIDATGVSTSLNNRPCVAGLDRLLRQMITSLHHGRLVFLEDVASVEHLMARDLDLRKG